jgi:hypothetical protein
MREIPDSKREPNTARTSTLIISYHQYNNWYGYDERVSEGPTTRKYWNHPTERFVDQVRELRRKTEYEYRCFRWASFALSTQQ